MTSKDDLFANVKMASEIAPLLREHLEWQKIVRVEWHDGHGDFLLIETANGIRLTVTARGADKLLLQLRRQK